MMSSDQSDEMTSLIGVFCQEVVSTLYLLSGVPHGVDVDLYADPECADKGQQSDSVSGDGKRAVATVQSFLTRHASLVIHDPCLRVDKRLRRNKRKKQLRETKTHRAVVLK